MVQLALQIRYLFRNGGHVRKLTFSVHVFITLVVWHCFIVVVRLYDNVLKIDVNVRN